MNRRSVTVAVLALTGFLVVACIDESLETTTREELMASLPVYPGATLVQKYGTSGIGTSGDFLWQVYATPDDAQAVRAFYKQNLAEWALSFDLGEGNDPLLGRFYKGRSEFYKGSSEEVDVFVWDHEMRPNPDKCQVATPPPGTATFFTVRAFNWAVSGENVAKGDVPPAP